MWTDVIDHNKSVAKQRGDSGRPDGVLFVVGSRGCGKTTLVNRLLYPDKTEVPKPTEGMEYNYARRAQSGSVGGAVDRKDVAHVWEIAGSRHFADEVTEQDNVFLGPRHVTTAVVAICVDLAKPHEAMRTAEYWLGRVHARCAKTFERLAARGSRLPEQLVRRSERVFGGGAGGVTHEDADSPLVRHSGVTVLIVATKHDAWRRTDPERMKVLVRALRFLAHTNAAGLFFLGGFGGGGDGLRSTDRSFPGDPNENVDDADEYPGEMRAQFNQFRAYLNHLMFAGADRKFPGKFAPRLDHLRPVTCPVGGDRLSAIGVPKGAETGEPLRAWRDVTSRMFPANVRDGDGDEGSKIAGTAPDLSKFPEREVDVAARTAAAELAAFRRSQAMLRAGAGAGAGVGRGPRRCGEAKRSDLRLIETLSTLFGLCRATLLALMAPTTCSQI